MNIPRFYCFLRKEFLYDGEAHHGEFACVCVFGLSSIIPDTIASVGPVQYAGVGPTEEEARGAALKHAANNAARELATQLNNLGVGGK